MGLFALKTSYTGYACYVRSRYVADRLAKAIHLIGLGDPIRGVKKPEVKPEVLQTHVADAL